MTLDFEPDGLSDDQRKIVLWMLNAIRNDTAEAFCDMSRFSDLDSLDRYLTTFRQMVRAIYFLKRHQGLPQELAEMVIDELVDNADLIAGANFPEHSPAGAAVLLGMAIQKLQFISRT